jgi:hypothetical protein
MKNNVNLAWKTLTGMIALGLTMAAVRAGAESIPQVVQIVNVEGNAQYSVDGRTWQTLHSGDVLKPGAVIRTAERSLVDVMLGEEGTAGGSFSGPNLLSAPGGGGAGAGGGGGASDTEKANIVRIFQSTVLGVDKLTLNRTGVDEVSDTQLDLRAGQIMANVKKLSAQSKYEIKLPNGVAGIRGTWTLVSSAGVIVTGDGEVKFAGVGPNGGVQVVDILSRQKYDSATGQVSSVSDSDFQQYVQIYQSMCSNTAGLPGPKHKFVDYTCGPTCRVDAN